MANIYTYNPKKVSLVLGTHIVQGFAEDTFINIELAGDGTSHVIGADGEIVRSIDPSDVYTMTITVLQNSKSGQYLQQKYEEDKENGTGFFSVSVVDVLGKEEFTGTQAWIAKPGAWSRGKEQSNREWEITVAQGKFNFG